MRSQPKLCYNVYYNFHEPNKVYTLCKKVIIHQVTTMLATSENVLFPGHNHLLTTSTDVRWPFTLIITLQ